MPMLPFAAQGPDGRSRTPLCGQSPGECRDRNRAPEISALSPSPCSLPPPAGGTVQHAARSQGRIYHFSGPLRLARDLTINMLGPQRMLARRDLISYWHA